MPIKPLCRALFLLSVIPLAVACSDPDAEGSGAIAPRLAEGVSLREVALFQGPKVTLMRDGAAPARSVPVVAGRAGLLRVYLEVDPSWEAREVVVRLERELDGEALEPLEGRLQLVASSAERDLESTVNFELPGGEIAPGLTWSAAVLELDPDRPVASSEAGGLYPLEGKQPLEAAEGGDALKVVLLPVRYDADGSGRLPDVSAEQIEQLRAQMHTLYPVRRVEITIGETLPWAEPISPGGNGWEGLLQEVIVQRLRDGAPSNVYYYGLFAPAASMAEFCARGCVAGLSPVSPDPDDEFARGSIGLGYSGRRAHLDAADTFVHEVGHAHGREHAPCELYGQPADRSFPYPDGRIGAWAYDLASKRLLDPEGITRDMMGYCSPIGISDYTYQALFDRISYLNKAVGEVPVGTASASTEEPQARWRSFQVGQDGALKAGPAISLRSTPLGRSRTVERLLPTGRRERVTARYYPLDHLPGGLLLVPEAGEGMAAPRLAPQVRLLD